MNQANSQMSAIFGADSSVFQDIVSAYAPIVAGGINQAGFSAAELANLNSVAETTGGQAFNAAEKVIKENQAAAGGVQLPSGVNNKQLQSLSTSAAENTASNLQNIEAQNYATGRQNFETAAGVLEGAPSVFSSANSATGAATGASTAAANTANQIAQENNSWVGAVTGALGGIAGTVLTGGMSNLGKGVGFFGQNAPAPG